MISPILERFSKSGLDKQIIQQNFKPSYKKHNHPIFPNSYQVFNSDGNETYLCIFENLSFQDEQGCNRKIRQIKILIELSRYKYFLVFKGFSIKPSQKNYSVDIYLEYGGNSFQKYVTMKRNIENNIITEEQLWNYMLTISSALSVLQKLNLRHGHLKYYAIRTINYQIKLLYYPRQKTCYETILSDQRSQYFNYFLSVEELKQLRQQNPKQKINTPKADVFSLGIFLLNLTTLSDFQNLCYKKKKLSSAAINQEFIENKLKYVREYYSKPFNKLLQLMIQQHQQKRINLSDLATKIRSQYEKRELRRDKYLDNFFKIQKNSGLGSVSYSLNLSDEFNIKKYESKKTSPKKVHSKIQKIPKLKQNLPIQKSEKVIKFDRGTFGKHQNSSFKDSFSIYHNKNQESFNFIKQQNQQEKIIYEQQFIQPILPKKYQQHKPIQKTKKYQQYKPVQKTVNPKTEVIQQFLDLSSSEYVIEDENQKSKQQKQQKLIQSHNLQTKTSMVNSQFKQPNNSFTKVSQQDSVKQQKIISQNSKFQQEQRKKLKQLSKQKISSQLKQYIEKSISQSILSYKQLKIVDQKLEQSSIKNFSPQQASQLDLDIETKKPLPTSPQTKREYFKPAPREDYISKFKTPGIFINGNVYYGSIINGRRNGLGLEIFPSNQYYFGNFQNDFFHGQGIYCWSNNQHFSGKFLYGQKVEGWMIIFNRTYKGQFKNNKRHGQGISYYDQYTYEGSWYQGKKHGKGIIWYKNGDIFKGEWSKGYRMGKGIFYSKSISIQGYWNKDAVEGKVQVTYKNGDIYKGQYINNQKTGYGQYFFHKGAKFVGNFSEDAMIQGEFYYPNNEFYKGKVSAQGKREGYGKYTYHNGDRYIGEWKNNKRHGQGEFYSYQYNLKGNWQNGLRQGEFQLKNNLTGDRKRVFFQKDQLIET